VVAPPSGTVTFLFTDIEGSSRMWEKSPGEMHVALARHDEILLATMEGHGGFVFNTVGDAFCAAFPTALGAVESALEAQRTLFLEEWNEQIGALRARMALHTGAAHERDGDYFGPPLNRVARLLSAAYGGQVLHRAFDRPLGPGGRLPGRLRSGVPQARRVTRDVQGDRRPLRHSRVDRCHRDGGAR
jgi:class 3 adenylate cyclase